MYTLGPSCVAPSSTVPEMKMRKLISSTLRSSSSTYQRSKAVSKIGPSLMIPLTTSGATSSPRSHKQLFSVGSVAWRSTNQLQYYRLFSTQVSAMYSDSEGDEAEEILEPMRIHVVSKQNIKPFAPTPRTLRTYKLSILDQLFPHAYVPMVFFYANTDQTATNISGLIAKRSKILRKSLSKILTIYYPFAGEVSNHQPEIDCNDKGVYYVETRVDDRLSDFLAQPNYYMRIHRLLPYNPSSSKMEKPLGSHVVMVQANFFKCGSLAISMCTSHKIIDGNTYMEFLRAWAIVARGDCSVGLRPSFASPLIFPANPNLPEHWSLFFPTMFKQGKLTTRRFVFDGAALDALKAKIQAHGASDKFGHLHVTSRVVSVVSLMWKCATKASRARHGSDRRSVLSMAVNLRPRSLPPLSAQSVGNLVWSAVAQWMPNKEVHLGSMAGHVKGAISEVNSDMVEEFKGEKGTHKIQEHLERLGELYADGETTDYYGVTSCCKLGENDHDFGWGKPSWTCIGNAGADVPFLTNLIFLMDSSSGDGIEAWVTLSEEDMEICQNDPELLSFARVDPSPLNN